MDCSPPGFSVHGVLQARIPEWVAIPFCRESSQPRGQTCISCIAGRFYHWATIIVILCYFQVYNTVIQSFCRFSSVQFSSVAQSCLTLWDPMNRSTPGLPVHHHLPEFTQTHVHWVSNAIQPSHPLLSPSLPAFNLSQSQGLFQGVSSSYQVAKEFQFQLQHQSSHWIFRTDFL